MASHRELLARHRAVLPSWLALYYDEPLALVAGALSVPLVSALIRLLPSFQPGIPIPIALELRADPRVMIFAFVLAALTSVVFALLPAMQATRFGVAAALHGQHTTVDKRRAWLRHGLVTVQIAMAMLLLVTAGLFMRSLQEAATTDVGVDVRGVDVIYHQAAMRSVPRSVDDPLGANENNVTGTLHVLEAARRHGVKRVVFASSSSVYGENPELPKREDQVPAPISPYAVSKAATEQYARVWTRLYGLETVALRYFNVFGPRQDPMSEYAAVIPRFILWALRGETLEVHGDGQQSRDFTYIDNVVEANILAGQAPDANGEVFNVGCGDRISLLEVIAMLESILGRKVERRHAPTRGGDVLHTLADVAKAKRLMGYAPLVGFAEGFRRTVEHFRSFA